MKIRRTTLQDRKVHFRDASNFVIATEGRETEKQYFEAWESSRIHVEVLATGANNRSSPQDVVDRLSIFRDQYQMAEGDELWLVLDVDRWPIETLHKICEEARSCSFQTAITNPCFEFWLYLHFSENDLDDIEFENLVTACNGNRSKAMEKQLRAQLGSYQKARLDFALYRPGVKDAIRRAKALDSDPESPWPMAFPGTRVYRLAERLLDRQASNW